MFCTFSQVPTGGDITISTPILLDMTTARMNKIFITTGGRLVFDSSAESLKLTANMVELTGGELWIGSEDCPYQNEAEILLTGTRDESEDAESVQKAILVREGTLEVHGKPKRSWTELAETVTKTSRSELMGSPIYSVPEDDVTLSRSGFRMVEFDSAGDLVRNWGKASSTKFNRVKNNAGNIAIVVISQYAQFDSDPQDTVDAFEDMCYEGNKESAMAEMVEGQQVAFVAVCHIGSPDNSMETVGNEISYMSKTGWVFQTIGSVDFAGMSIVSLASSGMSGGLNQAEVATYSAGGVPSLEITIKLMDSISTWETGDRIAIASTDYDFEQAEEFELLECSDCGDTEVKIMGPIRYTHWGEVTEGIEMRGEVGLLTRNVRFHGEMQDECYGGNLCDEFDYDTFGGHIKFLADFTAAKIENAEFFHMGQQPLLGAYPIHFHMCFDTSAKEVYIRKNSIHHTFSRCLTIHGTHNVTADDNIAFDHLGHCFFLEDGGEQDNIITNNLGFVTRRGTLILTDTGTKVSTFWITNPDNTVVNNRAAGSDGHGIWILVPSWPTGPSANADMGLTTEKQLQHTILTAFHGNVAHSNYNQGFRLDDDLFEDGSVSPDNYTPLEDPTDPDSDPVLLELDDFIAYKNSEGAWIKSQWTKVTNYRMADNGIGLLMASTDPDELGSNRQIVTDSRFVGETDNIGEPAGEVTLSSGEVIVMDRSIPLRQEEYASLGFVFYRGPLHLMNTTFAGYKANALRKAGAIGKKYSNPYFSSPINSVRDVVFEFSDPSEGSRYYDGDVTDTGYEDRDGNRHSVLLDWDGSLTTYPKSSIVRPIPLLMNARCVELPDWGPGTGLCPDRFTKLRYYSGQEPLIPTFMTRNDLMASEVEVPLFENQISYALNSQESYILHMNTTVPWRFKIAVYGLDEDVSQLVGVCVGVDQDLNVRSMTAVDTLEELKADETNTKYFYDTAVGVVWFR